MSRLNARIALCCSVAVAVLAGSGCGGGRAGDVLLGGRDAVADRSRPDAKTGLLIDAQDLVDRLFESQADRSTQRLLKRLARLDVLMIDEAGYLTLEPSQPNLLFRLVSLRCERKAPIIITSNLGLDELVVRMAAPEIAKPLKDRLLHRCVQVHIDGPSYREAQAKKRKNRRSTAPAPEPKT